MPDFLDLPPRDAKPRASGITHVVDRGLGVAELASALDNAAPHIDIVKFGWGTAYVSCSVAEKVEVCRAAGVLTCIGGTLLEIAGAQDRTAECVRWMTDLGMDCVEVSNGALDLSAADKQVLIRELKRDFVVLSEVGSKLPSPPVAESWSAEMLGDLEAGASWVVAEGRESGTVGLYDDRGSVRQELIDALLAEVPSERVIFEAPLKAQQSWLIEHVGPDVSLGNVALADVVPLETLRLGLRADTIGLSVSATVTDS